MLLSVIIPCYNCESTIEKCINSILEQTIMDFEIIAVNDGSKDSTFSVLKNMSERDKRIIVIDKENSGPSSARNTGLDIAQGEYIGFVDSDDYIDKTMYEKLINVCKSDDADMAICGYINDYGNGTFKKVNHNLLPKYSTNKEVVDGIIKRIYLGQQECLPSPCNKVYKNSFIHTNRFDESIYRGEDWWFNFYLYERANCIVSIPDGLYYYCQANQKSIMKRMDPNFYDEWKQSRLILNSKMDKFGFEIDKNIYYMMFLYNVHSLILSLIKKNEPIDFILNDDFYKKVIKYDKNTSVIMKMCHRLNKVKTLQKLFYEFLSRTIYKN